MNCARLFKLDKGVANNTDFGDAESNLTPLDMMNIEGLVMYESKTHDVVVRVEPDFLDEQSSPADHRFIWAYTVEIENMTKQDLQVVERFWKIADSRGQVQEVRGQGVVGEQPILKPGEIFRYTSGAPLSAPSGMMLGNYYMQTSEGERFEVEIPTFLLDSPHEPRTLN